MAIRGSHVLITGASSGIGRALAVEFAGRGAARIALVARRPEALADIALVVRTAGAQALTITADVGVREEIEAAVRHAERTFGHLDLVVANAGIGSGDHHEVRADELEQLTRVNYLGAANTLLAAVPAMAARRDGHLVAISSLAALRGLPRGAAYSASKAALDTLLEGLRVQLRPSNVRVTLVRPGFVDTPLAAKVKRKPFLLTSEDAATRIVRAIEAERRELSFPLTTAAAMSVVRSLPGFIFDRIATRLG